MSFLSRFSWCQSAIGPSLLYGPLALVCAWAAVSLGQHSAGAVVCGGLALFFSVIVVQEWRHAVTIRRLVARQAALST